MTKKPYIMQKLSEFVREYKELNDDYLQQRAEFREELAKALSHKFRLNKQDAKKSLLDL